MLASEGGSPATIAIAVVERDGCYLIGRRPEGAPLAGLWEFPGGKVEPGESPDEAARRECLEEAGVDIEVQSVYSVADHHYDHGRVRLHFFACAPLGSSAPPKPPFEWTPAAKLAKLAFPAANAAVVELLMRGVKRRNSSGGGSDSI